MSVRHFHLKQASGWFAAGREVETALRLLSDAAFKLFLWLCLHAERSCGSISVSTVAIAHELGKSETQIATALDELLHQGVCHHLPGETIRIADRFWPYQRLLIPPSGWTRQPTSSGSSKHCLPEPVSAASSRRPMKVGNRTTPPSRPVRAHRTGHPAGLHAEISHLAEPQWRNADHHVALLHWAAR